MAAKRCPFCGETMPGHRKQCGKPECAKAQRNKQMREYMRTRRKHPSFDCEHCGVRCVPGENVSYYAKRFCSDRCKGAWHRGATRPLPVLAVRSDKSIAAWRTYCAEASLERVFGRSLRRDEVAYRRAMRRDPCAFCGLPSQALDHIVPAKDGGADDWTNRAGICRDCNSLKGSMPLLVAMPWIPVATEYHRQRRELRPWLDQRATVS